MISSKEYSDIINFFINGRVDLLIFLFSIKPHFFYCAASKCNSIRIVHKKTYYNLFVTKNRKIPIIFSFFNFFD